ncbi:MAG TPA: ferritin-like domain-containing protein, partial [Polyangiales bacterium]|nr:ferritin-like domain-containing protein [Polyangiales bacterium]
MTVVQEHVRVEWQRRVTAEYGPAAITHSLLGWLLRLGASPTLLHEATRIVDDELVHAEMAFAVLNAAGGGAVALGGALGAEPEPGLSLLENTCALGVRVFCLGETVAVRLFKSLREGTTVEVARQALDRVLIDEVRHRDFGWLLLEWLAQQATWPKLSALIEGRLPAWFAELRVSYGSSDGSFDDTFRAWGLMSHAEYA